MSDYANISEMDLLNEQVTYDPDAELNPTLKLPDGLYLAELVLGSKGVAVKASQNRKAYLIAHITHKIIAPGEKFDGFKLAAFPTSIVFEGGTSMLHTVLKALGSAPPATAALGDIKSLLESTLSGAPQARVRSRWEATYKDANGKYITLARGMKNFKQKPDGSYSPFVEHEGQTIEAREQIVDWKPASANGAGA